MSLFPIFKVNKLSEKNTIDTIYVFCGSRFSEDINDLFDEDPRNKTFSDIFDKDELKSITTKKIDVVFINQTIHIDDSIGVIKLKIFEAIAKQASMSEIYLYCLKSEKLNPITVYQNLTQNDRLPLTKIRFNQLLQNLYDENGETMQFDLKDKLQYSFDDILKLDLNERTYLVGKPLGQKFVFSNEYPFISDPFAVTEYDSLLEHSRKELTTLNSNLLLETGPIFKNTIYLCLAKDVFEMAIINEISTEYSSKIYFPFLYQDNIDTIEELETKQSKLIAATSEKITTDTERNFDNLNMFYNVFETQKKSDIFSENALLTGIKSLKVIIYPEFKIKIPIDVIFKLIHATHDFPLIKYNPETRQANIYRLFAPDLTIDGRKIPYLQKATIFKMMRDIGKRRSVAVYTNIQFKEMNIYMACEFEDNGNITVYPLVDFDKPILLSGGDNNLKELDIIIGLAINPLIEQIKPFFEQSGLVIPLFKSIHSVNVEIRDMKYHTVYNIKKPIDINKFSGCISSVFTIESSNFKKGIQMRFKRVSNYDKRDSQEAFIIEKIDQGFKFDEILEELLQQFNDLDSESAEELIVRIRSELEVIRGSKRRALMIKINPGFQTTMTINLITSELTITVNGINDIYYLNTIPIYINTIVRITQDIDSSSIPTTKISTLCSGKEIKDIEFGQITAQSERSLDDNEVPILKDESPVYEEAEEQGEYMEDLLDILGFDEDETSPIEGGDGSSSEEQSSESIKTESVSDSSQSSPLVKAPSNIPSEALGEKGIVSSPGFQGTPKVERDIDLSDLDLLKKESKSSKEVEEESVNLSSLENSKQKIATPESEEVEEESISLSSLEKTPEKPKQKTPTPESEEVEEESISLSSLEKTPEKPKQKIATPESEEVEEESLSLSSLEKTPEKPKQKTVIPESEEVEEESVSEVLLEKPKQKIVIPESEELEEEVLEITPPAKLKAIKKKPELDKSIDIIPKVTKPVKRKVETKIPMQNKIKETAEQLENTVRDITGMKLKYPNPFSTRLEERMPQLFVKSKNEKIDLYTRMCPFNLSERRQPIILTKEEKDKIIAEHPDEINEESDFIEYGSDLKDSSKKFYYTCPRYWCLLTNTMVTEQDILDGKCGPKVTNIEDAIIPKKAKEVPKGKYVYQFYDDTKKNYPGFHKEKTPSGSCIPCCYSNWSTKEMKNRRDLCQGKLDDKKAEPVSEKEKEIEDQLRRDALEIEYYVKGPEKYGPQLGEHRWGFLPIAVQKFLHEVNEDCQVSKTNMSLKQHHMCILRHGVEVSSTQSFIACIASAIFYAQSDNKKPLINRFIPNAKHNVPTIKEMKEIMISAIDLDNFIKYQNGDLVTSFSNPNIDINMDDYKDTKLYKKMIEQQKRKLKTEEKTMEPISIATEQFLIKVAQSFENFKTFLRDNKITIDYTYLWDLVCMPNPRIFETGINLIVLEIPEDDATNNIELVCPTSHYTSHAYDARKRSLILIKRENYFEPVYGYRDDGKRLNITKTFTEHDKTLPKTLRAVFVKIIKPTLGECKNIVNRSNEYRFQQSEHLDTLIEKLLHKKYTITTQVLNFQGKVIGVLAKNKKGLEGYIPCYPSALTTLKNKKQCKNMASELCEYEFVYMNDDIWKSYEQTLEFMKDYYDYEEPIDINKVNCFDPKYFCRVAENGIITGFLTNTNQFVPIKNPIPISTVDDTIKTFTNEDMLVADINTLTNTKVDNNRVDFIKRIQLETNFFNVFRNTIRILFNDYTNSEKRKNIKEECNKRYSLYKNKLDTVIDMLHELVEDTIVFASEMDIPYKYTEINEKDIHTCISQIDKKCEIKGSICKMTDNKCQLVLPKLNLVNGTDNEVYYYGKMADELIRYNRIKSFIFKPQAYLSFGQIKYNLNDDEIIILQDLLTHDFFEKLIPADINRYAKYNTYDTAEPLIAQKLKAEFEIDEVINPYHERDCVKSDPKPIKSVYWKKCFSNNFKEIDYTGSNYCSLYLIIDVIKEFTGKKLTLEEIKDDLIEEYSKLTDTFTNEERINKIIDILREEAQFDANQIQDATMTFEQMIGNDGFIAVNFDLWLLLARYQIPSIFISSKLIPETRYNSHEFVCYTNADKKDFVFILTPAMYRRNIIDKKLPEYKLIMNKNGNIKINIDEIRDNNNEHECLTKLEQAFVDYVTIEDYIDIIFKKDITTKYKPKQKGMRKIELEEVSAPVEVIEDTEIIDIVPKKKIKKLKGKKIAPTLILEEEEEVIEQPQKEEFKIENVVFPEEEVLEITPIKKRKTKKQREKKMLANPPGKKGTRKKKILDFEVKSDDVVIVS
jgi:hypothetical protein